MSNHNVCFHSKIRKISIFELEEASYLELGTVVQYLPGMSR